MSVICWDCGKKIELEVSEKQIKRFDDGDADLGEIEMAFNGKLGIRHYCVDCKEKHDVGYVAKIRQYSKLCSEIMLEKAIKLMEKQNIYIYDYREAIRVVENFIKVNCDILDTEEWQNAKKFGSTEEVAAAIILIANEIKTKIQMKVGKYRLDFVLPSLKIVLEIDGMFHKGKEVKDSRRDIEIRSLLGKDWEIVRIPTSYIHKNIDLLPEAIKSLKQERQAIRKQTLGILPETYSERESKHYGKVLKGL